jgi:hypothetical protein
MISPVIFFGWIIFSGISSNAYQGRRSSSRSFQVRTSLKQHQFEEEPKYALLFDCDGVIVETEVK